MTSDRSTELGDDFSAANQSAIDFARSCGPEDWATMVPGEDWPVGVVVHHIAEGHACGLRWLEAMARGEAVEDRQDDIDRHNIEHAERTPGYGIDETVALLEENGARLEAVLRGLSDEELDRTTSFGPADGQALPTVALAAVAARHAREHLAHAQAALT
jgi:hypothetical protein